MKAKWLYEGPPRDDLVCRLRMVRDELSDEVGRQEDKVRALEYRVEALEETIDDAVALYEKTLDTLDDLGRLLNEREE